MADAKLDQQMRATFATLVRFGANQSGKTLPRTLIDLILIDWLTSGAVAELALHMGIPLEDLERATVDIEYEIATRQLSIKIEDVKAILKARLSLKD